MSYNNYSNPKKFQKSVARKKRIKKQRNTNREFRKKKQFNPVKKKYKNKNTRVYDSITLPVPSDFSLLTNADILLEFFRKCKSIYKRGYRKVKLDFSKVEKIGNGAITILISISGELTDKNVLVQVNKPDNIAAREYILKSGFFKYFKGDNPINIKTSNAILQKGIDKTDTEATAVMIHKAMETVWGTPMRNTKLQGMLIELMANTVNHAYHKSINQRGWYFSVNHYPEKNMVAFTFVDNGEGILNTISLKFRDKVTNFFTFASDSIIVDAFEGKFGSRTKLKNRGRGLPLIKKNFNNKVIQNLRVITNDIELDFDTGIARKLSTPFDGTFYHWELNKNCKLWTQSLK